MSAPPLRWGVLAAGGIARKFADNVSRFTSGTVVAVGSRALERAQQFADELDVPVAHGSYEALVADPAVQAVYVASPHSEHRDHALLAIAAGKHVLVEKAFTRQRGPGARGVRRRPRRRGVRHGGDVDAAPAARRRAARRHRARRDR